MKDDLKKMISPGERIMWEGKPDKKCFIFEAIFNPLLPFALVWGLIDFSILGASIFDGAKSGSGDFLLFMIPFFVLHLMPVWMYLFGILLSVKKYNNTYYIVTDRSIYTSTGVISKTIQSKPFAEMSHIDLHRGFFDQKFGVGDVICTSSQFGVNGTSSFVGILSRRDYSEVYNLVKKLQQDIYSDIMYPNDKRPSENHGYNTQYKGM